MKRIIVVICAVLLSFSAFAEKIKVTGKNTTTGNFTMGVIEPVHDSKGTKCFVGFLGGEPVVGNEIMSRFYRFVGEVNIYEVWGDK